MDFNRATAVLSSLSTGQPISTPPRRYCFPSQNEKTYSLYIYPLKTKSVSKVAIYARVSTNRQDPDRQVRELESFVDREYPDADLERYVDIISGTTDGGGKEYQRLRDDICRR